MVAGPSKASEIDSENSFSLIRDRDLTAETWNYLQAKLAKGKFTDEEYMDLINQYSNIVASKGCIKRPREDNITEKEENARMDGSGIMENRGQMVTIPGVGSGYAVPDGMVLSEMPQGLDILMNQTPEEQAEMIKRFKESQKTEVLEDAYEAIATGEECNSQTKRRRIELQKMLQEETFNRKVLFPVKTEPTQKTSTTTHEPISTEPASDYDIIQLGNIRIPQIGQASLEASYEALVDTAQALQRLTDVVHRLIQNHLMSKMI